VGSDADGGSEVPGGLRWCSDEMDGIRRKKSGRGFCYLDYDGGRISDEKVLKRIRVLAIPPA
jgi:DNA topoisomerase-1